MPPTSDVIVDSPETLQHSPPYCGEVFLGEEGGGQALLQLVGQAVRKVAEDCHQLLLLGGEVGRGSKTLCVEQRCQGQGAACKESFYLPS